MQIGVIGLGHMGKNLALNFQAHNVDVVAWNRSEQKRAEAKQEGLNVVDNLLELIKQLTAPRVVFLMVAAGSGVDAVLFEGDSALANLLQPGDIVIDGANSHYKQSIARAAKLAEKQIKFLDCGVSGGVEGAKTGACMMIGGDQAAFTQVEPLIKLVCQPQGYGYFGNSGAGHYVKMVHNGIEYGMMQALAEGMNLLSKFDSQVDLAKATEVWSHGSIIQSRLVEFLHSRLVKDPNLSNTTAEIGSLGTGKWTVEDALQRGVPLPVISQAVFQRYQSLDKDSLIFKVVEGLREEFGAHNSQERPGS